MNAVSRQTLARKIEYLRKQLEMLAPYRALTVKEVTDEVEKRYIVERLLEISIQSILDCSRMLVTLEDWRGARDDREALLILVDRAVISVALAKRLLQAKGFRNILVHEYAEVDPARLHAYLQEGVDDLQEFSRCVAQRL